MAPRKSVKRFLAGRDGLVRTVEEEVRARKLRLQKRAFQLVQRRPVRGQQEVALILGCQRSGTTLMLDIFEEDLRTATFPEVSVLSLSIGGRLRLRPIPEIKRHVERLPVPLVVLKPIVESQNARHLLEGLGNAHGIWMYRKYESVAVSDLALFGTGNGVRNLRLLLSNEPPNWRAEFVPPATRAVLNRFYSPDMPPHDAASLFWWARNALFFDRGLDKRDDVFLCAYEDLVSDPELMMRAIYDFLGVEFPARHITKRVHGEAPRGDTALISPDVRAICEELLAKLRACSGAIHVDRPERDRERR
jgi:hypothetical protein